MAEKSFEEIFSEIQTDMIDICLEYVDYSAEKLYIYALCEGREISSQYFYKINGKVVRKHKLNEIGNKKYDVSSERQLMCLKILVNDIKKLKALFKEYNREMPTVMKIVYDIEKNSVNAEYEYGPVYGDKPNAIADEFEDMWFEEMKSKEENTAEAKAKEAYKSLDTIEKTEDIRELSSAIEDLKGKKENGLMMSVCLSMLEHNRGNDYLQGAMIDLIYDLDPKKVMYSVWKNREKRLGRCAMESLMRKIDVAKLKDILGRDFEEFLNYIFKGYALLDEKEQLKGYKIYKDFAEKLRQEYNFKSDFYIEL